MAAKHEVLPECVDNRFVSVGDQRIRVSCGVSQISHIHTHTHSHMQQNAALWSQMIHMLIKQYNVCVTMIQSM